LNEYPLQRRVVRHDFANISLKGSFSDTKGFEENCGNFLKP